jgi:hypothetical protein
MTETTQTQIRPNSPRILRTSIILLIAVLILVAVGVFIINSIRNARNQPISYEPYPNAVQVSQNVSRTDVGGRDEFVFDTADPAKQVFDFYRQRLGSEDLRGCKDVKTGDEATNWYRCVVDNSQDEIVQVLLITIAPRSEGGTRILYEREWGR